MLNLANKITLTRILFMVPVIVLLHFPNPATCWLAAILFLVASLTDLLDGHIARSQHIVTSMGKFLDPLADKLLICSVLIMFVELDWVPAWISIIIIAREIAVTGLRAMAVDEGVVLAADRYGKLKTIMQTVAIVPLIIHYPVFGINLHLLGTIVLYVALVLTVFSGANYFYTFLVFWRDKHKAA